MLLLAIDPLASFPYFIKRFLVLSCDVQSPSIGLIRVINSPEWAMLAGCYSTDDRCCQRVRCLSPLNFKLSPVGRELSLVHTCEPGFISGWVNTWVQPRADSQKKLGTHVSIELLQLVSPALRGFFSGFSGFPPSVKSTARPKL